MLRTLVLGLILIFKINGAATAAEKELRFICKGHTPLSIRLHLGVLTESRASMTLDSEDLYPHTGGSWRLLLEKVNSQDPVDKTMARFTTYDDSFIFNLWIPRHLAYQQSPKKFATVLKWQTDEQASVYTEDLLCHPL